MKTPIEKANELIEKFTIIKGNPFFSNECAIIAVDEIIDELKREPYANYERIVFWQSVKTELELLKN